MASNASSSSSTVVLTENDIPGASLGGRKSSELKNDELRFWLKCRGDPGKGLKTKAELVKRVEDYIKSGRDKLIVDPDLNNLYLRRKEERLKYNNSNDDRPLVQVKYPSTDWSLSLEKMPMFTKAEMNTHIIKSGKQIANKDNNSVPTGLRKAKTFLEDEYLHDIQSASDQRYFYFKAKCCHSFRKNDPPHELKLAICILLGEVMDATCSCVAGTVGYCNHILALMLKLCKYTLYDCKSTKDLCQEGDQTPALPCTSELQKWHKKGGGSNIEPQPLMEVEVHKTKLDESSSARTGLKSLLYEARVNSNYDEEKAEKLKTELRELFPDMGLSQMVNRSNGLTNMVDTKFGKCPAGSILTYQLAFTESNYSAHADISAIPRTQHNSQSVTCYPRFPMRDDPVMKLPTTLSTEQELFSKLMVGEDQINKIERETRKQSDCKEWKDQRKYRFTASRFHLIKSRKRNHETFAQTLMHPSGFSSKYVEHGKRFEPVALMQYQKFMKNKKTPITFLPSGLVISKSHPVLGASADAKVIDLGCIDCFGLAEVKCPYTKANVTPLDACADPTFCMEKTGENTCQLKKTHAYYAQVQGQMGVTGTRWCDFIVYTKKGLYIQRVPFDTQYWEQLKGELISYYFNFFMKYATSDLSNQTQSTL